MRCIIALLVGLLISMPALSADRGGARIREREAALQMVERHHVTERYRYHVPVSAFSQRRSDEPRPHSRWRPQNGAPIPDPMW